MVKSSKIIEDDVHAVNVNPLHVVWLQTLSNVTLRYAVTVENEIG